MVKFALVGCGRIAHKHAEILAGRKVENAKLAAVCDIKYKRAQEFGDRYRIPAYSDMHEMVQECRNKIDVVNK